ncbi:L-lactate MFS transporter [Gallibacter sp. Marseille-QA0791]|uniref:L-lactate MFS transporter n=1 Tax=Gallibacter sp. Marseille-QA0791 TaxID=3378781 RepID=UPI003D0FABC8
MIKSLETEKKRWIILIAACICNVFAGTGYCWSVYQAGLVNEATTIFGSSNITASVLAVAFSINAAVFPFTMIAGGLLQRKLEPSKIMIGSAVLILAGMFLSGTANNVYAIWLGFGIITGFGSGAVYGITINNTINFFPDKKGLISGMTTCSFGLGSIIFPPIISDMIDNCGVLHTFKIMGALIAAITVLSAFFISSCPRGWLPKDFIPDRSVKDIANEKTGNDRTWSEMLKDVRFWLTATVFMLFASAGLFIVSQSKQLAVIAGGLHETDNLSILTISIVGIANSVGRLIWGFASDKIGRLRSLISMALILSIAAFALACTSDNYKIFIICMISLACCYGGCMGIYPALTADLFGEKNNSVNYGIMFLVFSVAAFVGPKFFTSLSEAFNSHSTSLYIISGFGLCAFALTFLLTRFSRKKIKLPKHSQFNL